MGNWTKAFGRVRASAPCADVGNADDWFGYGEFIFLKLCRLLLQINGQHLERVFLLEGVD